MIKDHVSLSGLFTRDSHYPIVYEDPRIKEVFRQLANNSFLDGKGVFTRLNFSFKFTHPLVDASNKEYAKLIYSGLIDKIDGAIGQLTEVKEVMEKLKG